MTYDWNLKCPQCGNSKIFTTEDRKPAPHLNCGECLMEKAEIVELKIMGIVIREANEK